MINQTLLIKFLNYFCLLFYVVKPITKNLILLILINTLLNVFSINLYSQSYHISGKIYDSTTKEPLAFVNIVANNSNYGDISDIDGKFNLKSPDKINFLTLSYVGYKKATIHVSEKTSDLQIFLVKENIELSGVVIRPGQNPADIVINKAIERKKINDPENISAFRYKSYSKINAEWHPNESYYSDSSKNQSFQKDELFEKIKKEKEENNIFIMESFSERIYKSPDKSYEKVIGTRISGFKNPNFASLATDVQPFGFYNDFIRFSIIGEKDYINPISSGSTNRYLFTMQDTLLLDKDSVFIISFKPKKNKTFNSLEGLVYINSNGYAIQNIIAQPDGKGLWEIKIQQKYELINGKYWFPVQLNYDWLLPKYPTNKIGMVISGRRYVKYIKLLPELKNSDFPSDRIILTDSAGKRKDIFWEQHRIDSLNKKEKATYVKVDKLGSKYMFDYYQRAVPELMDGYLPIGPIDFSLDKLFEYNSYEGIRLGAGIRNNDKISRYFYIGGYFGYGFKDKTTKYGGNFQLNFNKTKDLFLNLIYYYDYNLPGTTDYYKMGFSQYWYSYMQNRFDATEYRGVEFGFRPFKYTSMALKLNSSFVKPLYDYAYVNNPEDSSTISDYWFTEATLATKIVYKERLKTAFGRRISFESGEFQYPIFYITYTHGFNNILGGNFDYDKLIVAVQKKFRIKGLGVTSFSVEGGYIWQDLPYSRLFNGKGSYNKTLQTVISNTFEAMNVNEFISDKFVYIFFTQDFERLLFETKKFKPEFKIVTNIGFGNLKDPSRQKNITFKTMERGYYESGLIIDNILRVNLLNICYIGLGGGAFYRYGYYSYPKAIDNAAFKLSFKITWN